MRSSLFNATLMSVLMSQTAYSGGFSLYTEGNGAAVGNFAAGIAAEAADASIGWFNPAGLVMIHGDELVGGGVGVFPSSTMSGRSTFTTELPFPPFTTSFVEEFADLKTSDAAFVPSIHYAMPLGNSYAFGLSIVSPFGLSTDWGLTSPVRYEATRTDLRTINVSPELGGRVTPCFSIGAGLDLQYARVIFNRILGAPTILAFFNQDPLRTDSLSYNKAASFGVGFHAGILGTFNDESTRLGLNYQSKMSHTFYGKSTLSGFLAGVSALGDESSGATYTSYDLFSNPIKLPDILTFSAYQEVNDRLALLGSLVYTGWSVFNVIQLNNVAAVNIAPDTSVTQSLFTTASPQNYRDAWRIALGANYCLCPQWMLRIGGGYDQTPTNDIDRDMRLPDTSRWAFSVGAHYQMRPNLGIDLGYTHLFGAREVQVNRTDILPPTSSYTVNAFGKDNAGLVGAQLVWLIDPLEEALVPSRTKD